MHTLITRLWYASPRSWKQNLLFILLFPCSLIYQMIMRLRAISYRIGIMKQSRLPVPVISIGNLVVGGTGKTPVTAAIVGYLLGTGRKVALLSRGYGGSLGGGAAQLVSNGHDIFLTPQEGGDEPYLLAKTFPGLVVAIAGSRYDAGSLAYKTCQPDVFILDDGFQHLALWRDLDVVLLDARHPLGNGCCLPAGPLREPQSALMRAGLIGLTRWSPCCGTRDSGGVPTVYIESQLKEFRLLGSNESISVAVLQKAGCYGVAGIADPNQFFDGLRNMGIQLVGEERLADHCDYSEAIVMSLRHRANSVQAEYIITTQKDAVKLQGVPAELLHTIVVATLGLAIHDEQVLFRKIESVLG